MKHQHYWLDTGIPHPLVFLNGKFGYDCSVCDKRTYRREQPVNLLVPSAWEVYDSEIAKGNAALVMSPPIMPSNDQWSEGARYRELVRGQS